MMVIDEVRNKSDEGFTEWVNQILHDRCNYCAYREARNVYSCHGYRCIDGIKEYLLKSGM